MVSTAILVVNVGSTSFRFQLLDMANRHVMAKGKIDRVFCPNAKFIYQSDYGALAEKVIETSQGYLACVQSMIDVLTDPTCGVIDRLADVTAIGFKAVHAGEINYPVLVSDAVIDAMNEFSFVAPAHNPPYIEVIRLFREIVPTVPLVAVFETGFHRTIPPYASVYPLLGQWREKYRLRRYGFHGAAHGYVAWKIPQILGISGEQFKIVSCHLGGSSSLCAIKDGRSVDTSMGYSPQSGLPMNNRAGDLDTFAVLYLMERERLTPRAMQEILSTQSGLKGLSGFSGDVRELEMDGGEAATLALETLAYQVKKYLGSYVAVMNGVDVVSFSGGIGENAPHMRSMICKDLEALGIVLDEAKNRRVNDEPGGLSEDGVDISATESRVRIIILPSNEELMVAMATQSVVKSAPSLLGGNQTPTL